jgi:FAD/FMN-containing dehydrogenase
MLKQFLSSWGGILNEIHNISFLGIKDRADDVFPRDRFGIVYGNGRSYGDVCLNPSGIVWRTDHLDHIIDFDVDKGVIKCEAGILISNLQRLISTSGWLLPVSPGTQFITLGGAIANDVHGKNHHIFGSFGNNVLSLTLLRSNGEVISCSDKNNSNYFYATIGGIGLTGIIIDVTLKLKFISSVYLYVEKHAFYSLEEFMVLSDKLEKNFEHVVGWLDHSNRKLCRGFITASKETDEIKTLIRKKRPFSIKYPFKHSFSIINPFIVKCFNWLYFHLNTLTSMASVQHYEDVLYPLDYIKNWNMIYGKKGFYQYQFVVPKKNAIEAISYILERIRISNQGSFLSVIKSFSSIKSKGMLSFPREGVTFALDFPNRGSKSLKLLSDLDKIVCKYNGSIYLAKDARMPKSVFQKGYPEYKKFKKYTDHYMQSLLSKRLFK